MAKRRLITFDWALKRLLRNKANFDILEGFLSELLKDDITILEILESESNRETRDDKLNQVDLKVKDQHGDVIIIEVQYAREYDYFHRMLFGVSKVITEHMQKGQRYAEVVKAISVNILYFDLGQGDDYVYHGTTTFRGVHTNDELQLSGKQKKLFNKQRVADIYPEYYVLRVNSFDDVARDTLDEWIYFLKHAEIKDEFRARGLQKAKEVLDVLRLSPEKRQVYETYMEDLRHQDSIYFSYRYDGFVEGRAEGRTEGRVEGRAEGRTEGARIKALRIARNLLPLGLDMAQVAQVTGLSVTEIASLASE